MARISLSGSDCKDRMNEESLRQLQNALVVKLVAVMLLLEREGRCSNFSMFALPEIFLAKSHEPSAVGSSVFVSLLIDCLR